MKRARFLAALVPSLLMAALGATALTAPAAAAPLPKPKYPVPHCFGNDGTDLNEFYGVKERIVGPPTCREIYAKEKWVRVAPGWSTAPSAAVAVYPAGYTPSEPDPIDDFNSKFVSATYVLDIGTPQEKRHTFKKKQVLRTGFIAPDGLPYSAAVSPSFKAPDLGPHTHTILFTLKDEHCDGLGSDREADCLPAGTFPYTGDTAITVVPAP
ncbi:hypothetical protein [Streptomyces sp. AP-93]|uniref:hypothetical protein n=1 Tax=Streptomyces sp. AP-93 TaxID=2929048 RepID=UPI001FAEECF1|nr:hypothetical protein [Streptomyces sp. AP-93]MCJ0873720.1 hypothetical protein [Streptomyces sp. AP-93]